MHAQADESRRRNAALRDMADAVEAATGQARSADGSVTVTAASSGAVTKVDLTDRALETTPAALAAELTAVIAAAQRAALANAARVAAGALGEQHPLVADLESQGSRFGSGGPTFGYGE